MPGEQPKDTNVVVPSGVVAGSSSNGQEDVGRNAAGQATAGPSTKPKRKRKTKRIPGPVKKPRPFKHVKILTDRCIKVRRFLGRQKSFTGLTIPNILSQALTRREVSLEWNYLVDLYNYIFHFPYLIFPQIAKIVKALLERNVIYGNPDEAFGMLPDVKEEIKEEPQEDVEVTQVGIFNI